MPVLTCPIPDTTRDHVEVASAKWRLLPHMPCSCGLSFLQLVQKQHEPAGHCLMCIVSHNCMHVCACAGRHPRLGCCNTSWCGSLRAFQIPAQPSAACWCLLGLPWHRPCCESTCSCVHSQVGVFAAPAAACVGCTCNSAYSQPLCQPVWCCVLLVVMCSCMPAVRPQEPCACECARS